MNSMRIVLAGFAVMALMGANTTNGLYRGDEPGTGLVFATDVQYKAIPVRQRMRGVVPYDAVDLSPFFPPAGNQKFQRSCAAWAVGYGVRSYYKAIAAGSPPRSDFEIVSPSFIFNLTTPAARDPSDNCSGVNFPDTLAFLKEQGAVPLSRWRYDYQTCRPNTPSEADMQQAASFRIAGYTIFAQSELSDPRRYMEAISRGHPVIVAMRVVMSEIGLWKGGSIYHSQTAGDNLKSGHAMVVVGYDNDKRAFLLYNSWGPDWGDKGKMWIDYDTFFRQVREAYVVEGFQPDPTLIATLAKRRVDGAAKTEASPLDRLNALASDARCGRLKVSQENGTLRVTGFASAAEADEIRRLGESAGIVEVEDSPWPLCEARMAVPDNAGRDVSLKVSRWSDPSLTALSPRLIKLGAGDRFVVNVEAPEARKYLQVIYLQSDRTAKVLFSGEAPLREGVRHVEIGDSTFLLRASEPFGQEAIMVLASNQAPPLALTSALNVPEHAFLSELKAGLSSSPDISAAYASLQVLEPDEVALKTRRLLTDAENASLQSNAGSDGAASYAPPSIFAGQGAPLLTISQDESGAHIVIPETQDFAPSSIKVELQTSTGYIDLSSRAIALSPDWKAHLVIARAALAPGLHRIRVTVSDTKGRLSSIAFSMKT